MSGATESSAARDGRLIESANDGDLEAFGQLYELYREWVLRLAMRFVGRREEALDVLQETFVYLIGKIPQLELTGRLTTFLYPVVRHLSAAARRRAGRFQSDEQALEAAQARAEPQQPEQEQEQLAARLKGLPEAQREVLLMRFVDDMALDEIAAALEIPLGTVKSRIHNAMGALREDPHLRADSP